MTSVNSNFNFLCGRPHGAGPPPPVHMRPPEPDPLPPPCERHKWMAPNSITNLCRPSKLQQLMSVTNKKDGNYGREWGLVWPEKMKFISFIRTPFHSRRFDVKNYSVKFLCQSDNRKWSPTAPQKIHVNRFFTTLYYL